MKVVMKTAVGNGNLELKDIDMPSVTKGNVIIKIHASGICGTDLIHYQNGDQLDIPVVLGHEFSGEIVEIGDGVEGWNVGDRIVSETHAFVCNECEHCKTGDAYLCNKRKGYGHKVNGAFSEYLLVNTKIIHKIPSNMSYEEATVLQPAADIVHSLITNSNIVPGSKVVIIGPGPMGLLATQIARIAGASEVIVIGMKTDADRLKMAQELGAEIVINASDNDVAAKVAEYTNGKGAALVVEASGSEDGMATGLEILAVKGQLTVVGIQKKPLSINIRRLQLKEQLIKGSTKSSWSDYECAIELARVGKLDLKKMVTHVLPLSDYENGFNLALTKKACKVVFTPHIRA